PSGAGILVSLVAAESGSCRLEVQRIGSRGEAAKYQIRLTSPRAATPEDATRAAAARAFTDADNMHADSAPELHHRLAKFQTALTLWREIGDKRQEAATLRRIGTVYVSLHEVEPAKKSLQSARSLAQSLALRKVEAEADTALAAAYANEGDKKQAVE